MKLPSFSVKRPVTTTMLYMALLVFSVVSLTQLSIDILPEITFPALTITTTYRGAGPEDVEEKITSVIESFVGIVPDLREIRSQSVEGMSIVRLFFDWGTDLDAIANDVRARIEFAKGFLPSGVETPVILKFDLAQAPILFIGASAKQSFWQIDSILNDNVADPIKRIPGIGNVFVIGAPERQIRVDVSRQRLNAYGVGLSQITQALAAHNLTQPSGDLTVGDQTFFLRTPAEFRSVNEIKRTLIGNVQGRQIYLEDIAEVKDDYAEPLLISRQGQDNAAMIIVQKRSGANTVEVADNVLEMLKEIEKNLPRDVNLQIIFNMSEDIKRTINSLLTSVLIGMILVIIVTYIFLLNARSSFVVLVTIPTSLLVAFLFLFLMGYTINIMSLSSLAIAVGMVVDNAIVVLENITRRKKEFGEDTKTAAINGASEVGLAVSASTLTTVAVFMPLIFTSGLVGVMFRQLGAVISITLIISLAVSLSLSPLAASLVITENKSGRKRGKVIRSIDAFFESILVRLNSFMHDFLEYAFNNRKKVIFSAVGIFLCSLALLKFIGTEFFPEQDAGFVQGIIEMPLNSSLESSDAHAQKLVDESAIILGDDAEVIFTRTGRTAFGGGFEREGSNVINYSARLVERQKRRKSDKEYIHLLRERFSKIPGYWRIDFLTGDPMSQRLMGGGKPLSIEILGYDLATTDALAQQVKEVLEKIQGVYDVSVSREQGKLEYQLLPDRMKLAALGIFPSVVADTLNIAFSGRAATRYRVGKEELDIFVRLREQDRTSKKDISGLTLRTPDGRNFFLADLLDIELARGPLTIERKDQQRIITVDANIHGRSLGEVAADAESELAKIPRPSGITMNFAGAVKEQRDAFRSLAMAFLLGGLLTYMVMAALFESFRDPFIIMFSVPFAIVGVLWALFLTGQTLNIASFIGLVMLVGIVVNNAIVLIDYTIRLRQTGKSVREALFEAAKVRMRPILMTTTTTLFGMLPLALSRGQGAEVWRPLAVAVIGGLSVSTVVTLVLVPVLYDLFEERQSSKNEKLVMSDV